MSRHDLVIRGGTLVDGTGDAPREGDLRSCRRGTNTHVRYACSHFGDLTRRR